MRFCDTRRKEVPKELEADFETILNRNSVPVQYRPLYKKWLRYYWDFCHKYHHPVSENRSLPYFAGKLREKGQTETQIKQASDAISLYYEMMGTDSDQGTAIKVPLQMPNTEIKTVIYKTVTKKDQRVAETTPAKKAEPLKTFSWRTVMRSLFPHLAKDLSPSKNQIL